MPYAIRTYKGSEEWGNKQYLAHMNLGNDIYMSFFGGSVEEAEAKARSWYEEQRNRWKTLDVNEPEAKTETKAEGWGSFTAEPKQHGMSGKVWVINHQLKDKKRVDPSELDGYISQGYERAGPRTAFKE